MNDRVDAPPPGAEPGPPAAGAGAGAGEPISPSTIDAGEDHGRDLSARTEGSRAEWSEGSAGGGYDHSIFGRPPPPKRRSLASTLIWVVAVVILAILLAWGLSKLQAGGHAGGPGGPGGGRGGGGFGRGATTVGTARATVGQAPIEFDALGTVTPVANVIVRTRIEGTLDRVTFHEGQMVRAGQMLAEVDPRPYEVALKQAQGTLARDEAQLANARLDLNRYSTLVREDSASRQQLDTQSALVKQLQGTVLSDEASVASARLNLQYCRITAPVTGRVGLRHVDPGNIVQTGDANGVVTVTQVNPIDVVFAVPEDTLPQITRRLASGARIPVVAYDRSHTTELDSGELSAVDNQIDTTTGTVKVKARFANVSGNLFAAQFVNVRVRVNTLDNIIIVPASAVRHGAPGDFVYTLTMPDHTAHVRIVKPGPQIGDTIAILTGLEAGETVITDGGDRLSDGSKVMLPGERPQFGGHGGRGGGAGKRRGGRGGGGAGGGGGGG